MQRSLTIGSVSHGPDQPRTAPSSPPFSSQLSSCSVRRAAFEPAPSHGRPLRSIRTDLPAFASHFDPLYSTFHGFHTFQSSTLHAVKKFPHIPPQPACVSVVTSARTEVNTNGESDLSNAKSERTSLELNYLHHTSADTLSSLRNVDI